MQRTRIASIDIGATKVATIMADMNGSGDLRILGIGVAASQGMEKGMISNPKETAISISQSVRRAEKMAGYRLKSAYVGISSTDISSKNSRGVISIPHDTQIVHTSDRKRALEVASSTEVPKDQRLLHIIPRSYTLDGQSNIENPVGMHGFRLNVETHIVVANTTSVQIMTKCLTKLGIGISGLILKSLASAEAILTNDEKLDGAVLVDIGGDTTDIAVFKNGSIHHTATLPVGGHHITNDIAVGLGIPFNLADTIKKKHGDVMTSRFHDVTVIENGCTVSCHDLREIISARIEELFQLILLQATPLGDTKSVPSRLVITGGSCNLPGITGIGNEITRLPVRVGFPADLTGADGMLCDPAYSTGVGLLYWKMKGGSQVNWKKKYGFDVLLPRWLGYLNTRSRFNNRIKERESGEIKLRAQSRQN
jgi:cell division protein FtsA